MQGLQGSYFLGIPTQYLYSLFEAIPPTSWIYYKPRYGQPPKIPQAALGGLVKVSHSTNYSVESSVNLFPIIIKIFVRYVLL